MDKMREKILSEGSVLPGKILKVGSFLNQRIDTAFLREMAEEVARLYADSGVTKIFTVESSGIPLAVAVGMTMGLPVVFAKKHETSSVDGYVFSSTVYSHTHGFEYNVVVSCDYLCQGDKILIVDDFLANGSVLRGLLDLAEQAEAETIGIAVAIEKGFQHGGDALRKEGIRVESLAIIEDMSLSGITFRD